MKKRAWIIAILCLAIVCVLYFHPIKVEKELTGMLVRNGAYANAEQSTLSMSGKRYKRLFEKDEYVGRFALDFDDRTTRDNACLYASMSDDSISFMTYLTDQGYITVGYFVAPKSFDWIYICIRNPDGTVAEVMAPAADEEAASAIKQRASERGFILPSMDE